MTPDIIIDYNAHLKNGSVWIAEVELPMQDAPDDEILYLRVSVEVIAPNPDLAQYVVTTMYPDYESICISNDPLT